MKRHCSDSYNETTHVMKLHRAKHTHKCVQVKLGKSEQDG